MARQFRLWEYAQIVDLLAPAADAGGRTSPYVSLREGLKAYIVCKVAQGNAAQVTFTPLQATDNLGSNSKAIGSAPIAANLNTSTSTGTDQFTFPAAAATYQTDAGLNNKIVIFEIQADEVLDVNNTSVGPFNHVAVQTSASNAANVTEATLFVMPLRDPAQNPATTYI